MKKKIKKQLIANKLLLISDTDFNAPLSKVIQKEYNKLISLIAQIPLKTRTLKLMQGTGGKVSIADIVAYQIGWGTSVLEWYKAGVKGKMPLMPGHGFAIWDYVGLARYFYKKYQYDNGYKQEKMLHNVVKQIIAVVENEFQNSNLEKIGVWPWCTLPSGKQWPLSKWITINSSSAYKRASALIRKFLKEQA